MTRDHYGIAFQQGFERTVASLMARGANCDEAREVAQSAWVKGWERISQLRNERLVLQWVNAIARHTHLTTLRHTPGLDLSQVKKEPSVAPAVNLAAIDMRRALQKCKPHQRELLDALLDGHSNYELATQTGKSLGAIHADMSRMRRELRVHMHVTRRQVLPGASVSRMKVQREDSTPLSKASGE